MLRTQPGAESVEGQTPTERKRSYHMDWEDHLEATTEEAMLSRTSALALDYVYVVEVPDDLTSEQVKRSSVCPNICPSHIIWELWSSPMSFHVKEFL